MTRRGALWHHSPRYEFQTVARDNTEDLMTLYNKLKTCARYQVSSIQL